MQACTVHVFSTLIVLVFTFSLEINGGPPVPRRLPIAERTYLYISRQYLMLAMLTMNLTIANHRQVCYGRSRAQIMSKTCVCILPQRCPFFANITNHQCL